MKATLETVAVNDRLSSAPAPLTDTTASDCDSTCAFDRPETSQPVLPEAQSRWAARSIIERLQVIRKARHWIAANSQAFSDAISPELARIGPETLLSEVLPVLDAMRFLEQRARRLLAPRKLGSSGRPLWLSGVQAEIHHPPLGHILVIGPFNFPFFIPAVQVMQALAAGNAVTWKPGAGGEHIALLCAHALREAGLPRGILSITGESVEAAQDALAQLPDKVIFTGSSDTGRKILRSLADTTTPAIMELSGSDAVIVLPSADLHVAAKAIAFGLRLNGAEVCMSPRRLIATAETLRSLRPLLDAELAAIRPIPLKPRTADALRAVVTEAIREGAQLQGEIEPDAQRPILLDRVTPSMHIAQSDIFAPVLSILEAPSVLHIPTITNHCPYALTAAIFGHKTEACALGAQLRVGTVLVNDLIGPTVDPRVPFGGLRQSGFGVARGPEGLLEMTATKTVLTRRRGNTRFYTPLRKQDQPRIAALLNLLHGRSFAARWKSLRAVVAPARKP